MTEQMRNAVALTHVPFEDLGSLQPILKERGYSVQYADATQLDAVAQELIECDLLVVLGGPIGVYEAADYPFLHWELAALTERLQARRPTLGICLGAQLMAAALGARVYAGKNGAEIGWSALEPGDEPAPAWFNPLLENHLEVLHWHGDTFDLPEGSVRLAGTQLYKNQAFVVENFALGLQFHPEVTAEGLERWYVGHTAELRAKGMDIGALRLEGRRKAPLLAGVARGFWNGWLDYIL